MANKQQSNSKIIWKQRKKSALNLIGPVQSINPTLYKQIREIGAEKQML